MLQYPEIFTDHKIKAFFTKRIENFEEFKKSLPFKLYLPIQTHTDHIVVLSSNKEPEIADAVITDMNNIFIGIKTADCLPILIFDPKNKAIGAVHAGWKGTANGILRKTIIRMNEVYGCSPETLLMAMGPCIKGCCYEVGDEVIGALKKEASNEHYIFRVNNKNYIDLSLANKSQALALGVRKENIWISSDCTYCKHSEYASYRFYGKESNRQYGIIGIL